MKIDSGSAVNSRCFRRERKLPGAGTARLNLDPGPTVQARAASNLLKQGANVDN